MSSGSDGSRVYASGLVTGDGGSGGVCTLTATAADGKVLTGTIDAEPTPAAVNCGLIEIVAPQGAWTLVLSYSSADAKASSGPVTVTQP
ncbi:hypothetical protein SK224_14540 [Microbacterium sp. BG28]|uniref:hypothetical protein n=1 Tax=Microbacterium sp. BG28 TaxID=3097356 RepID=UPI002A5A18F2|nr:hypothetical protein [Microbacterium sp. BG28]MDY0830349.1 hypothetical protein [Microbacterium sp. BG28]